MAAGGYRAELATTVDMDARYDLPMPPTSDEIRQRRLRSTHLIGAPLDGPEEVVRWHGAVQAQDYGAAKWALGLRIAAGVDGDIDRLFNEGRILRTHVLRPTWHFVLPEDIRWLLRLTAPRVRQASAYYYRQMELDDDLFRRAELVLTGALSGGRRLSREEIGSAFRSAGIEAGGVRLAYLVGHAELEGLVCSGGLRGRQFTYALLDEVAPPAPDSSDHGLAELTIRYFRSHGPAQLADFAWWAGLTLTQAREGVEMASALLAGETLEGREYWRVDHEAPPRHASTVAHLLPNFDEYTVAYKDRRHHFDAARIGSYPNSAVLLSHVATIDGLVIGCWRRTTRKDEVILVPALLVKPSRVERAALEAAARRYAEFAAKPARWSWDGGPG